LISGGKVAENSSVCAARQSAEDALHVGQEAHVEHAVGFVEDEDLDAETQRARSSGRAGGPAWRSGCRRRGAALDLRLHADAAEDAVRARQVLGRRADALGTCAASSRVGVRISARGRAAGAGALGDRRCSSGRAKAAVLPVPVWARPSRSRPSSSGGMAGAWIGRRRS
jgi:hypothetical protein